MSFWEALLDYMEDNSIGTKAVNLFKTEKPDGAGVEDNIVVVLPDPVGNTPGQLRDIPEFHVPLFEVYIRNTDYEAGEAKMEAVRTLLHGVNNISLVDWKIRFCEVYQEGGCTGSDGQGRYEWTKRFTIKYHAI